MKLLRFKYLQVFVICLLLTVLSGCAVHIVTPGRTEPFLPSEGDVLVRIGPEYFPEFSDDYSMSSLKDGISQSLKYLGKLKESNTVRYAKDVYTVRELKESLSFFLKLVNEANGDFNALNRQIKDNFAIYTAAGADGRGSVFFTGYYMPKLKGSRVKTDRFQYPLYSVPHDKITAELGSFKEHLKGEIIVGRIIGTKLLPYYTNAEIMGGVLGGRGLELFWVDDKVDLFFLQVQGSGVIELTNGASVNVGYGASNGHTYKSIGKLLADEGKIPLKDVTAQSIRKYLKEHPEETDRIISYNPSYVFFKETKDAAVGAAGMPLVAGRNLAVDKSVFPLGSLVFVSSSRAEFSSDGEVKTVVPLTRFALCMDTGGAIKGPGRADFFWGSGKEAESQAGVMKSHGRMFFIVKKKN
ncbi:MAG: MltA domain-containing protein [Nitrospirae bacterium]|nr:MltA domain-containing protein [Nitrospirota bacterium]MBF0536427.1 MltA domain-containing protein [Nitrospirota bacterium]MBF0618362.1 MltA domain-containing protein [Nitrospirota bacterium]